MNPDIYELRAKLFEGKVKVTITSPNGTDVGFRFGPVLDDEKRWDGRAWWLFRGSDYVGIVKRAGQALTLQLTARSTDDRVILKAAGLLLDALRGEPRDGYTITVREES